MVSLPTLLCHLGVKRVRPPQALAAPAGRGRRAVHAPRAAPGRLAARVAYPAGPAGPGRARLAPREARLPAGQARRLARSGGGRGGGWVVAGVGQPRGRRGGQRPLRPGAGRKDSGGGAGPLLAAAPPPVARLKSSRTVAGSTAAALPGARGLGGPLAWADAEAPPPWPGSGASCVVTAALSARRAPSSGGRLGFRV